MSVTLVVAGDLCAAGRVGASLSGSSAERLWSDLAPILGESDFSIVNLESPLTDRAEPILKEGPVLWGPPAAGAGIRAAGFAAVSLANNHILDAGPRALLDTIGACDDAGLLHVGAGETHAAATRPLAVAVGDLRLSVLAFAENEFSTTSGARPGAWPLDVMDNARQITRAREASDFVLVLVHGGVELHPLPSPQMQKRCRFFVEMGADAVICHHTHVVSGYESYDGRPIAYGLGNLLFDPQGQHIRGWSTGCLARFSVDPHRASGFELVPYTQDGATPSIKLAPRSDRDAFDQRIAELNTTIADPARLEARWSESCRQRGADLLGANLCLTSIEAWLLHKGALPTSRLRLTRKRVARLRNLYTCESHHEACERLLESLLEEGRSDR